MITSQSHWPSTKWKKGGSLQEQAEMLSGRCSESGYFQSFTQRALSEPEASDSICALQRALLRSMPLPYKYSRWPRSERSMAEGEAHLASERTSGDSGDIMEAKLVTAGDP